MGVFQQKVAQLKATQEKGICPFKIFPDPQNMTLETMLLLEVEFTISLNDWC